MMSGCQWPANCELEATDVLQVSRSTTSARTTHRINLAFKSESDIIENRCQKFAAVAAQKGYRPQMNHYGPWVLQHALLPLVWRHFGRQDCGATRMLQQRSTPMIEGRPPCLG